MVAGMVMPLADLRAIYELLFRDGVMVAKKDRRPQCMHPEIQGVANVKVMRAMGSLKSKGFVRETFAWKHSYWYLTNEGIVYLRDYLRLPPEIMPSSLQRVRRPASTLDVMRRARRGVVQTVEGPTSYAPKPRVGQESQEGMIDRQGYRHKRGPPGEEEALGEKPAMRFRGSYQGRGRGAVGEPGAETQAFFRRGQGFRREEQRVPEEGQIRGFAPRGPAYPPPLEARPVRSPSPAPAKEVKPFVTEVPAPAPIKPEKPQEVAVLVPVAQIIEPAFIPTVEPEVQAPALELEEVVEEVTVEEVAVEAPMPVEEAEPEEEEVSAVEAAEVLSDVWEQEEPKPVVEEIEEAAEEAPEPVVVEVVEAIKEEVLEATAPVETLEEKPKQSAEESAEESVEESTEDVAEEVEDVVEKVTATEVVVVEEATAIQVVVVEDAPEVPAEDLPHDTDIEILEEPEEVEEEPSTHEEPEASSSEASSDSEASEPEPITAAVAIEAESEPATTTEGAVEAESEPVTITEAIQEVKASVPLTKDDSTEPDSDTDLSTPPPPVTEDFTDLTEYHEQTVVGHITQEIPTMVTFRSEMPLEVTSQVVTSTVYSTVVEKVFETQISQSEAFMEPPSIGMAGIVSQLGLEQETSVLFGAECTAPVIPSECPIAALKSSLPQGDLAFLTEEPEEEEEEEEEEEVKKIWPDTLEG